MKRLQPDNRQNDGVRDVEEQHGEGCSGPAEQRRKVDCGQRRGKGDVAAEYNGYCESGSDEQFFKDAAYLNPVAEGPFYAVQSMPAGWLSLGGIKTNAAGQALDAHNHAVTGLYVAGADADLFTSPYYQMASCNGFCLGSGIVTGEAAAAYALA